MIDMINDYGMYKNSNRRKSSLFLLNFLYKLPRSLAATPLQKFEGDFLDSPHNFVMGNNDNF